MTTAILPHRASERAPIEFRQGAEPTSSAGCFLVQVEDMFLLAVEGLPRDARPTALSLGSLEIPGPLLTTRRGGRLFVAGRTPDGLGSVLSLNSLTLGFGGQRETLRFADRPLAVLRGAAALAEVRDALADGGHVETQALLLRVIASFSRRLSPSAVGLVEAVFGAAEAAIEPWMIPLDAGHRYIRFALAAPFSGPVALVAKAYLVSDRALAQLNAGRALVSEGAAHLLLPDLPAGRPGTLVVTFGDVMVRVDLEAQPILGALAALEAVAASRPADGTAIRHFVLSRCAELSRAAPSRQLGELIWSLTAFPTRSFVRPDMEFGVAIENVLPVPGEGVLFTGWLWDPNDLLEGLVVMDGQGHRVAVTAPLHRLPRPDVQQVFGGEQAEPPGFVAFQRFAAEDERWPTWQVKGKLKGGLALDLATDLKASRRVFSRPESLLALLPGDRLDDAALRDLAPAVAMLQTRGATRPNPARVRQFLEPPADPWLSVVVPIYKRLDHARHQLAHFASDPDFANVELIYVLDWPDLRADFERLLEGVCPLYDRAVTLVTPRANRGFAGATNAGALVARGRHLLLLNSDVIPDKPGWTREMARALDDDATIGAVGARLLYEDGSLQHAGMDYLRHAGGGWKAVHPGKGMRGPCASGPVTAVTAACMMLPTALYRSVGGLSEDYVIGDFEDSDLCWKLRGVGKSMWLCAEATLYHLERQSMGVDGRYNTSTWKYNQWLHHRRWAATIAASRQEESK